MWIFLSNAFLSIVEHHPKRLGKNDRSNYLLVRARFRDDIQRVLPGVQIKHGSGTDYAFRAVVRRERVEQAIADAIAMIDYDNFKNSVGESDRHNTYLRVWNVMKTAQDRKHPEIYGAVDRPLPTKRKVSHNLRFHRGFGTKTLSEDWDDDDV
jgi:hypothetical protein